MGSACVSETCKSLGGPAVYVLIGCLIPLSSSGSVLLRLTMYPILLYRLALLFYEYFLTLDDEVMFFWNWKKTPMQSWKRWLRPSLQKFMYFLNRYGNLLYTIHIVLYKTQSLGGKVSE